MYTATLKSKTFQRAANRILVVVEVTDGTTTYDKEFSFSANSSIDRMKKAVSDYLAEVNNIDLTSFDDLDYTEPTKTQAEQDKEDWLKKRQQLSVAMDLVRDGVFTGDEAAITKLQQAVKTGFKVEYLG